MTEISEEIKWYELLIKYIAHIDLRAGDTQITRDIPISHAFYPIGWTPEEWEDLKAAELEALSRKWG